MHSFCFFSMKGVGGNLRDLSGCNFCVFFFIYFSTRYGELLSQIIECRTGPWSKEQLNYTILRGLEAMGLCSLTENLLTRNLNSKISVWNPNSRWYGDGSMGKCTCCTRVRVWAQVPASQKKKRHNCVTLETPALWKIKAGFLELGSCQSIFMFRRVSLNRIKSTVTCKNTQNPPLVSTHMHLYAAYKPYSHIQYRILKKRKKEESNLS